MTAIFLALALLGCGEPEPSTECVDDGDCEGLSVCTDAGACRQVECLDSSQCSLGTHCNAEAHTCFTGCQQDADCYPGHVCDAEAAECVLGACTDTEVDCWIGQTCTESGECLRPEGLCMECTTYDDPACEEDLGGVCSYVYQLGGYRCFTPCDPDDPASAPRGFECVDYSDAYVWDGSCADAEAAEAAAAGD